MELEPCPFCGGEAERLELTDEDNFGGSVICCKQCGASSPVHFDRKENLEDSWNRRTHAKQNTEALGSAGEKAEAIALANRLLDEPNADPDDDLRVLSRQLPRALHPAPGASQVEPFDDKWLGDGLTVHVLPEPSQVSNCQCLPGSSVAWTGVHWPLLHKQLSGLHAVVDVDGNAGPIVQHRYDLIKPAPLFDTHGTHSENASQRGCRGVVAG